MDLLPWARRTVAAHRDLENEADLLRGAGRGTLRIGAIPTTLPAVARLTSAFVQRHDDVRVELRSTTSGSVLRGLRAFDFDLGVTYLDDLAQRDWRSQRLYVETYVLVGPAGGPFAERETVGWGEFDGVRLCLLTDDMRNRQLLDARFAAAGVRPDVVATTDAPAVLLDHVRAGLSSVVASSWLEGQTLPGGFQVVRLDGADAPDPEVGIVRLPDERPRPLVTAFLSDADVERRTSEPSIATTGVPVAPPTRE
jgi:DNA-binding transcriptional LysR family regulator